MRLALALFMLFDARANDPNNAFSADDAAIFAYFLHGSADFHDGRKLKQYYSFGLGVGCRYVMRPLVRS